MSFHLLEALSHYSPDQSLTSQKLDLTIKIAEEYVKWKKSKPFDKGITTQKSLKVLEENQSIA